MKIFDENVMKKSVTKPGIQYYSIEEELFDVRGVFREKEGYVRMPRKVAKTVSMGIAEDYAHTAGGRVRFVTDSPYVAVSAVLTGIYHISIMSLMGTCGMDVYADGEFCGIIRPDADKQELLISDIVNMRSGGEHLIEINLPLYAGVEQLLIGIDEGACLKHAPGYFHDKPIVFYGSSITNGACSSRPGMAYPARLSRMLDTDYINLGFGGLCKAEQEMMDYIATLSMSVFVLDYDHNAKDAEYLRATHEKAYWTVREKHPKLPIIMISCPRFDLPTDWAERLAVIRRTYENAVKAGDTNVYLLNGSEFFAGLGYDYSQDGVHPNDLGFDYMARAIYPTLKKILK